MITDYAIDRLRADLRRVAPRGERYSHRAAARTIGCSASRIPELMCRLESRGEITRTPYKNTYLIDASPLIDQGEAGVIDQPPADPVAAQPNAPDRPDNRDRVKRGCMDDHDSKSQEEESARSPLFERLVAEPSMSRSLARRIAAHPPGRLADFEADLRIAQTFARSPFFFTVARWRDGQRVIAPEESHDAYPARSAPASGTRRGSRENRPAPTDDPDDARSAAAYYAEILAAPRATEADFPGLPVRRQWSAAHGG
jgi:hypothetical protein